MGRPPRVKRLAAGPPHVRPAALTLEAGRPAIARAARRQRGRLLHHRVARRNGAGPAWSGCVSGRRDAQPNQQTKSGLRLCAGCSGRCMAPGVRFSGTDRQSGAAGPKSRLNGRDHEPACFAASLAPMLRSMIAVTDDEAAKVRPAFERSGALVAAAEMGRLFPGLGAEDAQSAAARTTARWHPGRRRMMAVPAVTAAHPPNLRYPAEPPHARWRRRSQANRCNAKHRQRPTPLAVFGAGVQGCHRAPGCRVLPAPPFSSPKSGATVRPTRQRWRGLRRAWCATRKRYSPRRGHRGRNFETPRHSAT